jgi:hypothetical protein
LTKEADVVARMRGCTTESEWNKACDEVKAANGGYPQFWFMAIILGLVGVEGHQIQEGK